MIRLNKKKYQKSGDGKNMTEAERKAHHAKMMKEMEAFENEDRDIQEMKKGGEITSSKAKEILKDGMANGKKLTPKQARYMGWVAGGRKMADGGDVGSWNTDDTLSVLGDAGKMAGTGAAVGTMIAPGIGTAIGAGVGGLIGAGAGIYNNIMQNDAEKIAAEMAEKQKLQDESMQRYITKLGYQQKFKKGGDILKKAKAIKPHIETSEGGLIKGKTKGVDNEKMKAEESGFIVPVKNAPQALSIGEKYLGWDKNERATKTKGDVALKVTPGEVYFTPEEKASLLKLGIDLSALAPEAKTSKSMQDGGDIITDEDISMLESGLPQDVSVKRSEIQRKLSKLYPDYGKEKIIEITSSPEKIREFIKTSYEPTGMDMNISGTKRWPGSKEMTLPSDTSELYRYTPKGSEATPGEQDIEDYYSNLKKVSTPSDTVDNTPDKSGYDTGGLKNMSLSQGLGAANALLRVGTGIYQTYKANKALKDLAANEPNREVPTALYGKLGRMQQESQYGFDPYTMSQAKQEGESTKQAMLEGGQDAGSRTIAGTGAYKNFVNLMSSNAQFQQQKKRELGAVETELAGAQDSINKYKIDKWWKENEAAADLSQAGMENIDKAKNYGINLMRDNERMNYYKQLFA